MTDALSRRGLLRGAVAGAGAAGLLAGLGACGSVADSVSSAGDVRFWNLFSGGDGILMNRMLDAVEHRTAGLRPHSTVLEWGSAYYTKLAMASAGGRGPDLAIMHVSRLPGYAPGGLLDPWDLGLLAEFGVRPDRLNPEVFRLGHYQDALYALPLDTHPFVVFYDKEVMDQAGLLDSDGKLADFGSPEGYLDAAEKLRRRRGKLGPVFGHANDTAQDWRMFWALYTQTGAAFDLTGRTPRLDHDAAVKVVRFMRELTAPDCRTMDYPGAIAAFTSGGSPMIFSGEWETPAFRGAAHLDLGAAPFPTLFGRPATYADSHTFVLPHQDRPDEARRRRAHQLAALLLKSSLTWATAGHIPAYLPVVDSPAYARLDPQSSYAPAAKSPAPEPQAWFTGSGSDFQARMCQAMQQALTGAVSAEQAVRKMVSGMEFFLSQPNPA